MFHQVSHNPFLLVEGIDIHPEALPIDELRQRAWQVFEPRYLAWLAVLFEEFGRARSQDLGDVEFDDLAHPEIDDALGNLGALALKMGGEVVIIPTERMPTETGIAAIYRY
jgi:hypothetical protein